MLLCFQFFGQKGKLGAVRGKYMKEACVYKPFKFFLITYLITWSSWFLAAYFSYQEGSESVYVLFMIPGLIAPSATALCLTVMTKNQDLKKNYLNKLINFRIIRPSTIPAMLLIVPVAIAISILISLSLGLSADQFNFSEGFSFSAGSVPALLVLFFAAIFEELGWRSYAMDSLQTKHNYFTATFIFAFLWAFWHFPLFFIKDYYHYNVLHENLWFAVNFIVSVFPMAFIIGWFCQRNRGSIIAAILFHFIINLSQEAWQIDQITKCIETGILIIIAIAIVLLNKEMFFENNIKKVL
jgi:membrane protease YdiL (CAAX protease family)